jgi:hypothetical protein
MLIKIFLGLLVRDSWQSVKKSDVLFLSYYTSRSYSYQGKSYGPLLDSIALTIKDEGITSSFMSFPYVEIEKNTKSFNSYGTMNRKFFPILLYSAIKALFFKTKLREVLHTSEYKNWIDVISNISPSIIIAIQPPPGLCRACHELSIPVYDFQHGVVSRTMLKYSNMYTKFIDIKSLPSGYLCWDHESLKVIEEWSIRRGIEAYVTGNPWLSRFSNIVASDHLVQLDLDNSVISKRSRTTILLTLQWGLDYYYPDHFSKNEFVHKKLIEAIKKNVGVDWIIRIHPLKMKSKPHLNAIKSIFKNISNVSISSTNNISLFSLLSSIDGHITWDSSCVIEASSMSVKSFILNPGGFSEIQVTDGGYKTGNEFEEIPYEYHEKMGFVTRSQLNVSVDKILHWVSSLKSSEIKVEPVKQRFDNSVIVDLVTKAKLKNER